MDNAPNRDTLASDADRESVSRWLAAAAGEGRITTQEMEDRLVRARHARTYGDLEQLVHDLPSTETPGPTTSPETLRVSASMRSARMRGTWRVPPRIVASAGRGTVLLDFTEAVIEQDEVTVDARPNWRSVTLIIPDRYAVTTEESVPGTGDIRNLTATTPRPGSEPGSDGPRIHVVARPGLGSVIIKGQRQQRWRPRWRRPKDAQTR